MLSATHLPTEMSNSIWLPMIVVFLVLSVGSIGVAIKTWAVPKHALRWQIYAWWPMLGIICLSLYFYPVGILVFLCLISIFAAHELSTYFSGRRSDFWLLCASLLVAVAALHYFHLFAFIAVLVAAGFIAFYLSRSINRLLMLLFCISLCGISFLLAFQPLLNVAEISQAWLCYLFIITALNDVAQFISGTLFGKQKIAVKISPNKTWQGLIGGLMVSILLSVALGSYLQLASTAYLGLLGLLLSLGGFGGDLLFSAAKRHLGIKDFSRLIPGHGGILDRVDSLVVTAPLLYAVLYFSSIGFL